MTTNTAKVQERSVGLAQILNMRIRTKRSFVKITLREEVFTRRPNGKDTCPRKGNYENEGLCRDTRDFLGTIETFQGQ